MRNFIVIVAAVLSLSACTSSQKTGAVLGAGAGAVVGAVTSGTVQGTVIGATAGAIAGTLLGSVENKPDKCYYRGPDGRVFVDDCPNG